MFTRFERTNQTTETKAGTFEEITPFGEELSEEMLQLVAGGRMAEVKSGSSKSCSAATGQCSPDRDFGGGA